MWYYCSAVVLSLRYWDGPDVSISSSPDSSVVGIAAPHEKARVSFPAATPYPSALRCPSSLHSRGIRTRSAGSALGRGFSLYKSLPRPMGTPTNGVHVGSWRAGGSAPAASTLTSSSMTYSARTPEVTA